MFAPVFWVYLQTRPHMGDRPIAVVGFYSAEGPDYLKALSQPHLRLAVGRCQAGTIVVSTDCAGVLAGVAPGCRPRSRACSTRSRSRFGRGLIRLQPAVVPALYENVPPFGNIRAPARYSVLAGLPVAGFGLGAARLLAEGPDRPVGPRSMAGMLAVISYEALPDIELVRPWLEPPPIYGSFDGKPPSVLAEFPMLEHRRTLHRSSPFSISRPSIGRSWSTARAAGCRRATSICSTRRRTSRQRRRSPTCASAASSTSGCTAPLRSEEVCRSDRSARRLTRCRAGDEGAVGRANRGYGRFVHQ